MEKPKLVFISRMFLKTNKTGGCHIMSERISGEALKTIAQFEPDKCKFMVLKSKRGKYFCQNLYIYKTNDEYSSKKIIDDALSEDIVLPSVDESTLSDDSSE